jgi:hypothetical protein
MHFKYENRAWSKTLAKIDVDKLATLIEEGRKITLAQNAPSQNAPPKPATEKQVAFLKQLILKHRSDWFDVTDGIGGTTPPSDAQIERMTGAQVSNLIETILDFVKD